MNVHKDIKVDYSKIADLSKAEITEKIRSGEIPTPPRGEEREKLLSFAAAEPGSDNRNKFLSEIPAEQPDDQGGATPGDEPKPDSGNADLPGPPAKKPEIPAQSADTDDEWLGYGNRESLIDGHKSLKQSVDALQKQVKDLRGSGGKLGRKVKDLETQLEERQKDLEEARKRLTDTKPTELDGDTGGKEKPKRPDPGQFEDGEADPGYYEAMEKYNAERDTYIESMENRVSSLFSTVEQLEGKLQNVETKASKAHEFVSEETETRNQSQVLQGFDSMWDETRAFQKELGLNTSTDIRVINENWLAANNRNATDTERKAAESYLKSLPQKDVEAFKRLAPVVNSMFDFSGGVPQKRYNSWQACLWDTQTADGKPMAELFSDAVRPTNQPTPQQKAAMQRQREEQSGAARAMSAADYGSGDKGLNAPSGREEKLQRLKELNAMRAKNPRSFDGNSGQLQEYVSLAKELGFRTRASSPS